MSGGFRCNVFCERSESFPSLRERWASSTALFSTHIVTCSVLVSFTVLIHKIALTTPLGDDGYSCNMSFDWADLHNLSFASLQLSLLYHLLSVFSFLLQTHHLCFGCLPGLPATITLCLTVFNLRPEPLHVHSLTLVVTASSLIVYIQVVCQCQ